MESFFVVAEERSIRHAAERLNLSASAISRQMVILEQEFGTQLLIRLPRGVQLTEQGKMLRAQIDEWKSQGERLRSGLQSGKGGPRLSLRIGIMECLAEPMVAPFYDRMLAEGVNLNLEIHDENSQVLAERLVQQKLDIMVAFNVPRMRRIRIIEVEDCAQGVVFSPDHPIADAISGGRSPKLADCLDQPLCLPNSSLSFHTKMSAEIARYRKQPNIVLRSNSIALIREFVAQGKGIAFLNWHDVKSDVESGRLCFADLKNRRLVDRLAICTLGGLRQGAHHATAIKVLRALLTEMRPQSH
ncbi:MAG: LysR family transcriptional regulator [Rhodobacterales bacterium]|nr:LysR family transcriptional regulator [Rhodobacterales bacterium]